VRLASNAFQIFQVAGLAHQHAQLRALADKRSCDMVANESGSACKKDFHAFC
jgi:hypothetical protein